MRLTEKLGYSLLSLTKSASADQKAELVVEISGPNSIPQVYVSSIDCAPLLEGKVVSPSFKPLPIGTNLQTLKAEIESKLTWSFETIPIQVRPALG